MAALVLPAAMLFAPPAQAQRDFSKVEIILRRVAGNMYHLQGADGDPERFLGAMYSELGGQ